MTSQVRHLLPEEVPLLLPGAREFFSTRELMGKLNEPHLMKSLQTYIGAGLGFVLVTGIPLRGALGAMVVPDFATGDVVAMELFWFVREEERGSVGIRLLRAFEAEAATRGAKRIVMMHLVDSNSDKFNAFYTRAGYRLREHAYVKEL